MLTKTERSRVKGFLKTQGTKIINGNQEEIILTGWGLGNWLLCEGYMWKAHGISRFDRPRRMEKVILELTNSEYADYFWKTFRENYITREDIKKMAELGYNSVRIPFNWRLFMEDETEIIWKSEGFELLDRVIDWCEEFKLYAFLDMHGAPGGQTGSNIDDSIDNIPRLFMDTNFWHKAIELWKALAHRYKDRWIVGGYDLLNEPIRPQDPNHEGCYDHLLPKLVEFYEAAITAIRQIDSNHLFSIEGHHWASSTSIFFKHYDENMVIHFHRYACLPDISCYKEFLELSNKWNIPLWLGESGENFTEWFTAMYPLAVSLGISYNLWPWKKMDCTNSPYSISMPKDWSLFLNYIKDKKSLDFETSKLILDNYLESIKLENCTYNEEVHDAVLRQPGCHIRATDFDELPGKGISYSGLRHEKNPYNYRLNTFMQIEPKDFIKRERRFSFDCLWDYLVLTLITDEFACYSLYNIKSGASISIDFLAIKPSVFTLYQDDILLKTWKTCASSKYQRTQYIPIHESLHSIFKIQVKSGSIHFDSLYTRK